MKNPLLSWVLMAAIYVVLAGQAALATTPTAVSLPGDAPQALVDRYWIIDNGGVIYDQRTGLQWMRCAVGQSWNQQHQRCDGTAQTFTWAQARNQTRPNDWRAPTLAELRSLVYCSTGQPVIVGITVEDGSCRGVYQQPTIVTAAFPDTEANHFWSADGARQQAHAAWFVNFSSGVALTKQQDMAGYVRLVRSGRSVALPQPPRPTPAAPVASTPPRDTTPSAPAQHSGTDTATAPARPTMALSERFDVVANGTVVHDKETELQWMRCSLGQEWHAEDQRCTGEPRTYQWQELADITLTLGGHSDWRVPSVAELRELVYCSASTPPQIGMPTNFTPCSGNFQRPTIARDLFPNTEQNWYWTRSELANPDFAAWSVSFYAGTVYYAYKHFGYPVRLVRGGD